MITEQKYQCPYQGECQINNCNPEQNCYTRQILDERNNAEQKMIDLDNECQDKFNTILKLEDRIKELKIKLDKWQNYAIQKEQALDEIKESITNVLKKVF